MTNSAEYRDQIGLKVLTSSTPITEATTTQIGIYRFRCNHDMGREAL
jgi:hypothetical protein